MRTRKYVQQNAISNVISPQSAILPPQSASTQTPVQIQNSELRFNGSLTSFTLVMNTWSILQMMNREFITLQ